MNPMEYMFKDCDNGLQSNNQNESTWDERKYLLQHLYNIAYIENTSTQKLRNSSGSTKEEHQQFDTTSTGLLSDDSQSYICCNRLQFSAEKIVDCASQPKTMLSVSMD